MLRLLLLRHARATQDSGEGDHARALTGRGREDSVRMGRAMNTRGYVPDLVVCSDAARTIETWRRLSPELAKMPKVAFTKALYLASPKNIRALIASSADDVKALMLIGHNPGIEECAIRLARKPVSKAENEKLAEMREKFPTCALAVLDFDVESWSGAGSGGILLEFLRPRDLMG
ncbi:MAG: histidine phosphatase family protein [Proteobacteria bacterium]|nr:histidine phosphatase family protein [Pseudomonadota bacterium]